MPCPSIDGLEVQGYISLAGVTSYHNVYLGTLSGKEVVIKEIGARSSDANETAVKELFCAKVFHLLGIYCPAMHLIAQKNRIYLILEYVKPNEWVSINEGDDIGSSENLQIEAIEILLIDYLIGNSDRKNNSIGIFSTITGKRLVAIDHHRTFIVQTNGCAGFLYDFLTSANPSRDLVVRAIGNVKRSINKKSVFGMKDDIVGAGSAIKLNKADLQPYSKFLLDRMSLMEKSMVVKGLMKC